MRRVRDDAEIDFENDAREFLIRNAREFFATTPLAVFERAPEFVRVVRILSERSRSGASVFPRPPVARERVLCALADYRGRIDAEERNSSRATLASSTVGMAPTATNGKGRA